MLFDLIINIEILIKAKKNDYVSDKYYFHIFLKISNTARVRRLEIDDVYTYRDPFRCSRA